MKAPGNVLKKIKECFSWFIAILSFIFGIIGLVKGDSIEAIVVYIIVIINSIVLIGLGIYLIISYLYNRGKIEEKDHEILQLTKEKEAEKENAALIDRAYISHTENTVYLVTSLHDFLQRLYSLTDRCFAEIANIQREEKEMRAHSYTAEEIEEKITKLGKEKNRNICANLYDDYKRFLSNILTKTQNKIESYLRSRGYDLEVSLTLKMLVNPIQKEKLCSEKANVYTAFRDSRTWNKRIRREVAQKLFVIEKNTDFIHCIVHGTYIFNNKSDKDKDYYNENTEFYKYYNCGITVLINSGNKENEDNIIYGFLTCDVLNDKYPEKEIMDNNIAMILRNTECLLSIYFDNIGYNWYLLEAAPEFESFWEMVYKEYLVAI